jgi:hypothetical protein
MAKGWKEEDLRSSPFVTGTKEDENLIHNAEGRSSQKPE